MYFIKEKYYNINYILTIIYGFTSLLLNYQFEGLLESDDKI